MTAAFVVAAPRSGAGKTTVTLALLAALTRRGLTVQPFKAGPDYIDPSHHAWLTGRPSHNLDTWMLSPETNRRLFTSATWDADVAVVEGVMGLYDGVDGVRPDGSTAHLARQLGLPVVLVVDARSSARSAAAVVHGFATFAEGVELAGVVWNRVGSASHRRILDESLAAAGLPPALGAFPTEIDVELPERHLGLVTPEDAGARDDLPDRLADLAREHLDLDRLLTVTGSPAQQNPTEPEPTSTRAPGPRIGVPRDTAFCFYYEENLRIVQQAGARLVFFRPVEGEGVPPGLDGLYLGGGYPEMHATRLSSNRGFLDGMRTLHARGVPIYAECGGFMTLCRGLTDPDGRFHPMANLFPTTAHMNSRRTRLGYREVTAPGLGDLRARGHEFHYSHVDPLPSAVERSYRVWNARGEEQPPEGYRIGSARAGYIHLHFGSNPVFAHHLFGLGGTDLA